MNTTNEGMTPTCSTTTDGNDRQNLHGEGRHMMMYRCPTCETETRYLGSMRSHMRRCTPVSKPMSATDLRIEGSRRPPRRRKSKRVAEKKKQKRKRGRRGKFGLKYKPLSFLYKLVVICYVYIYLHILVKFVSRGKSQDMWIWLRVRFIAMGSTPQELRVSLKLKFFTENEFVEYGCVNGRQRRFIRWWVGVTGGSPSTLATNFYFILYTQWVSRFFCVMASKNYSCLCSRALFCLVSSCLGRTLQKS